MRRLVLAAAAAALLCGASAAAEDRLANPAQEGRAHQLFRQIRCVVCQNESIDDSEAELAGTLRAIVRGQIAAGRSDAEIRRYLVDRYGEFVLLKPRLSPGNALLWLTPLALVGGGLGVLAARRRRGGAGPGLEAPLSPEEVARLEALMPSDTVPPQSGPTRDAERV